MFKCDDCGCFFDEPDIIEEHYPFGMRYVVEYWAACPLCHSSNYECVFSNKKSDYLKSGDIIGGR